ncbi:MAG: hypothetical protein KJ060_20795, partial [Candidatus Hydrogenedentes bacterium]|nr:hypothetical protein [Candidatus Hydrogenedentota bacterium]
FFYFFAVIIASLYAPRFDISTARIATESANMYRLLITYFIATLPYFFAGWILGVVYRDYVKHIHFLYFADLVGAALGCFAFLAAMRVFGAVGLVLIAASVVVFPLLILLKLSWRHSAAALVCMGVLIYLSANTESLNENIEPEETKALVALYDGPHLKEVETRVIEFSEWNPISRIDVASSEEYPMRKRIFIDGDAWTGLTVQPEEALAPWNPETECMITWAAPYLIRVNPKSVLVIGSGGGVDVFNALRAKAQDIDAVEINPTTARIVLDEYGEETRAVFDRPEVTVWNEEGRSFVRRGEKLYDVIVMNAIDTFSALSAGAYVLSESYLYTVEAMKDYIEHLKPEGVLSISRWKTPAESVRLFTVVIEALYEMGFENPEDHITAIYQPNNGFIAIMVSPSPFSEADMRTIRTHCKRHGVHLMYPLADGEDYGYSTQRLYASYARARKTETSPDVVVDSLYDARPVWDDSPFFFNFLTVHQLWLATRASTAAQILRGNWSSLTLFSLLGFLAVAVFVFMAAPLLKYGRGHMPNFKKWLVYFTCLGLSFIFIEIALMQRFALLLGHPSRSIALVLATLLLFAGIGSQIRGRYGLSLSLCVSLLLVAIVVAAFVYPAIISYTLGWTLLRRSLVTVLLVAPLGIFMGMPFPEGLRMVSEHGSEAVPWMWGVNGGSTVLGSVIAIILAMAFNFTTVFLLAGLGYAIALMLYVILKNRSALPVS